MFVAEFRTSSPRPLVTASTFPAVACAFARTLGSTCLGSDTCECLTVINGWAERVNAWSAEQRAWTRIEALRRLVDAGTVTAWPMGDGVGRMSFWDQLLVAADRPQDSFQQRFVAVKVALRDVLAQRHTGVLDPQSLFQPALPPNNHFWSRFWPAAAQLLTSNSHGFGVPCPSWALVPVRNTPAGSWYGAFAAASDAELEEIERRTFPQFARYRLYFDLELPDSL